MWRKMDLKLPLPLRSVATLPCETVKWSTIPLYTTAQLIQFKELMVMGRCRYFKSVSVFQYTGR